MKPANTFNKCKKIKVKIEKQEANYIKYIHFKNISRQLVRNNCWRMGIIACNNGHLKVFVNNHLISEKINYYFLEIRKKGILLQSDYYP
jgi:hypothetical protein